MKACKLVSPRRKKRPLSKRFPGKLREERKGPRGSGNVKKRKTLAAHDAEGGEVKGRIFHRRVHYVRCPQVGGPVLT